MKKLLGILLILLPVSFLIFAMGETYGYFDGIAIGFGLTTVAIFGIELITE